MKRRPSLWRRATHFFATDGCCGKKRGVQLPAGVRGRGAAGGNRSIGNGAAKNILTITGITQSRANSSARLHIHSRAETHVHTCAIIRDAHYQRRNYVNETNFPIFLFRADGKLTAFAASYENRPQS